MKTNKRLNASTPTNKTTSIMISINKRIPSRRQDTILDLKPSMSTPTSTAVLIKQKKNYGICS